MIEKLMTKTSDGRGMVDINVPCNLPERASTAEEPAKIRLTKLSLLLLSVFFFFQLIFFFSLSLFFQLFNGRETRITQRKSMHGFDDMNFSPQLIGLWPPNLPIARENTKSTILDQLVRG